MRSLTRLTFGMVVDRRPSPGHELGKLKLLILAQFDLGLMPK